MFSKKVVIAAALLAAMVFAASARGSSDQGTSEQSAKIDYRFNAIRDDGENYFNWSADGDTVQDSFDAASGASKAQSTTKFNVVRYDETGQKKAIPGGLRGLVLYPVSPRSTADTDAFTVETQGNQITISFVHRNFAYRIVTDTNGRLNLSDGDFQMATVCDNVGGKFVLKDEYVKAGGDKANMADADWSKIPLAADRADSDAGYRYDGTLTLKYSNDVLTMTGNLTKK